MSPSAMVFLSPMIRLIILLIFYCLLLLERSHYLGNSSRSTWTKVETVSCLENDTIVSLCILGNSARCNGQKVCRIAPVHTTGGASTCTEGRITQRGGGNCRKLAKGLCRIWLGLRLTSYFYLIKFTKKLIVTSRRKVSQGPMTPSLPLTAFPAPAVPSAG